MRGIKKSLTRQHKKQQERLYAKTAAKLLGKSWDLSDDREPPDFVVTEGEKRFGLELASLFVGDTGRKGAVIKRKERENQQIIETMRHEFEKSGNVPLNVKLVGNTCATNMAAVVPGLIAMGLSRKPIGFQGKFVVEDGPASLTVYVTRSLQPDWYDVAHRVGWVETNPVRYISDMITRKAAKLGSYKESAGLEDIRLFLVADRIMNSGKMSLDIPANIDLSGFQAVYFLSYPCTTIEIGAGV